jgi:hypothetical protein
MDTIKLGKIIEGEVHRDAIHMAIAPVVAGERLAPGQHVGVSGETAGQSTVKIGIVDPFLPGPVFKGDRFWLFLYPNTITSLRHEWTHPAFEATPSPKHNITASEVWLREFALHKAELTYEELMYGAAASISNGDYMIDGGKWEGFDFPEEFWDHYETVTGEKVGEENRHSFFSCAC